MLGGVQRAFQAAGEKLAMRGTVEPRPLGGDLGHVDVAVAVGDHVA